jgi:hypothetical protein
MHAVTRREVQLRDGYEYQVASYFSTSHQFATRGVRRGQRPPI